MINKPTLTERFFSFAKSRRKQTRPRKSAGRRPLGSESLESRVALTATPIQVDTFVDAVDPNDGLTSLREAIQQAAANPGDDTIELSNGKYKLDAGQLTIEDTSGKVTIEAPRRAVLDAQAVSRVMNIVGSDVELNNLVVTGGSDAFAAGLRVAGSQLTMNNGRVVNNHAAMFGGGFGIGEGSTVVMKNTSVIRNSAGVSGGGIAVGNGMDQLAVNAVELIHSRVTRNSAGSGRGISLGAGEASLHLKHSTVALNTASAPETVQFAGQGGGIVSLPMPGDKSITLTGSRVTRNSASGSGGGIWMSGSEFGNASLDVEANSKITRNRAGDEGGGIYLTSGTLSLDNAKIKCNSPDDLVVA